MEDSRSALSLRPVDVTGMKLAASEVVSELVGISVVWGITVANVEDVVNATGA